MSVSRCGLWTIALCTATALTLPTSARSAGYFAGVTIQANSATRFGGWVDGNGPNTYQVLANCKNGRSATGVTRWAGDRRGSFVKCPSGFVYRLFDLADFGPGYFTGFHRLTAASPAASPYAYGGWFDGNGPDSYEVFTECPGDGFADGPVRWAGDRRGSIALCPYGRFTAINGRVGEISLFKDKPPPWAQ